MQTPFSEFLRRARQVHGSRFEYNEETYSKLASEVGIICPEHGLFFQSAKNHIDLGHGCSECSEKKQYTTETWITKALLVHGDYYSYEKVEFTTQHQSVIITCPRHGDFAQVAAEHTNKGHGCRKCAQLQTGRDNFNQFLINPKRAGEECELYIALIQEFFKIGISRDALKRDRLYEEMLYQRLTTRAVAWSVEQKILIASHWAAPPVLPSNLQDWAGSTELRMGDFIPIDELSELLDEEIERCEEEGWLSYARRELLQIE